MRKLILNPDFLMHYQYRTDYANLILVQSQDSTYAKVVDTTHLVGERPVNSSSLQKQKVKRCNFKRGKK